VLFKRKTHWPIEIRVQQNQAASIQVGYVGALVLVFLNSHPAFAHQAPRKQGHAQPKHEPANPKKALPLSTRN
jgi:hypothetical protein